MFLVVKHQEPGRGLEIVYSITADEETHLPIASTSTPSIQRPRLIATWHKPIDLCTESCSRELRKVPVKQSPRPHSNTRRHLG